MSHDDIEAFTKLKSEKFEKLLDQGMGECILRRDDAAKIVADALRHFDDDRYVLWAWCVMPNHVHAVVQPLSNYQLPSVLHSWKSFTSKQIGKLLGRTGALWLPEYFDHLIRDEADFNRCFNYTINNPVVAGLTDWSWVGCRS